MITRMKKLELLLYHSDRDSLLARLQTAGVVHIAENSQKNVPGLAKAQALLRQAQHALRVLPRSASPGAAASGVPVHELIVHITALEAECALLEQEQALLQREETLGRPWGALEPAHLCALEKAGLCVRLFTAPVKAFEAIDKSTMVLKEHCRIGNTVYFALFGAQETDLPGCEVQRIPQYSLAQLHLKKKLCAQHKADATTALANVAAMRPALEYFIAAQDDQCRFLSAAGDLGSEADGKVLSLRGFFPQHMAPRIEKLLANAAVWWQASDPQQGEEVPVQLKNGPVTKLFEPVTKLFMLPSYWELDPTPFLAPFFTLFVGLCLGDVAYGTVLLIIAFVAHVKVAPVHKPAMKLIMILAVSTIGCGVLLNSIFGVALFGGPGVSGALVQRGPFVPWLSPVIGAQGTQYPAMSFALLVGFVQLVVAIVLQFVNRLRQRGWQSAMLPVSSLLMLCGALVWMAHSNFLNLQVHEFSVGALALGSLLLEVPVVAAKGALFGGVALLLWFNNWGKKAHVRIPLGLYELYNFVTGRMGDLLSYIRLFALGLCGGLLGATVNTLALGFIATPEGGVNWFSPMAIFTVLLLVGGHALNFALALVGAFVHPVRLTFVEFFGNLSFSGGGKPYVPFTKTTTTSQEVFP